MIFFNNNLQALSTSIRFKDAVSFKNIISKDPSLLTSVRNCEPIAKVLWQYSAQYGAKEILEYIADSTLSYNALNQLIHADNDAAFIYASSNGHLEVMKYLVEHTYGYEAQKQMIHSGNDTAFRYASYNGHTDVKNYLVDKTYGYIDKEKMIKAGNEAIIQWVADNNQNYDSEFSIMPVTDYGTYDFMGDHSLIFV